MLDRKNFHPTNHCSNIRDLYRSAQAQLEALDEARQRAGQRANDTQRPFLGDLDAAEEQRLRAEANEALRDARRLEGEFSG